MGFLKIIPKISLGFKLCYSLFCKLGFTDSIKPCESEGEGVKGYKHFLKYIITYNIF